MNDQDFKTITSLFAAMMAAAQDKALCSPEGCQHAMRVRWKDGHSVCVICRTVVQEPTEWGLFVSGP